MKIVGRILIGILFFLLFLVFVILTTAYFELLNASFVLSSFERNHAYEKVPVALANSLPNDPNLSEEERMGYADIAESIPPHVVKLAIETNLVPILDYVHGKSKDVIIVLPAKELKLPGVGEDIRLSLVNTNSPETEKRAEIVYGIGNKILLAWAGVFLLLFGLLFLYGRLLVPKKLLGGSAVLFVSGGVVLIVSLVGKFFFIQMARDLAKGPEPSQALLSILASSLLPDIATTWLLMGGVAFSLGFVLILNIHTKKVLQI